jgi:hypothetical protein
MSDTVTLSLIEVIYNCFVLSGLLADDFTCLLPVSDSTDTCFDVDCDLLRFAVSWSFVDSCLETDLFTDDDFGGGNTSLSYH